MKKRSERKALSKSPFPLSPSKPVVPAKKAGPVMPIRSADDAMAHPCVIEAIRRRVIKIEDGRVTYTLNHEKSYNCNDPEEWVRVLLREPRHLVCRQGRGRGLLVHRPLEGLYGLRLGGVRRRLGDEGVPDLPSGRVAAAAGVPTSPAPHPLLPAGVSGDHDRT